METSFEVPLNGTHGARVTYIEALPHFVSILWCRVRPVIVGLAASPSPRVSCSENWVYERGGGFSRHSPVPESGTRVRLSSLYKGGIEHLQRAVCFNVHQKGKGNVQWDFQG